MTRRASLDGLPTELVCYICGELSLTDIDALEHAYETDLRDIIADIFRHRLLHSEHNPLFELVSIGRIECIEELASCSALDVNVKDRFGRTPLHIAAAQGLVSIITALLQYKNINKDAEDGQCQTPLATAISNHHMAVIQLLVSEGASTRQALTLAVGKGFAEVVSLLLGMDDIDVNERNKANITPLFLAAEAGSATITAELLSHKQINPDLRERGSLCTPFLIAASRGHAVILVHLMRHVDVDIHASDREERTALSLAAEQGHLDVVRLLLSLGANPHHVDRRGRNCLHYATQRSHERVTSVLLLHRCNAQLLDNMGMTALSLAVKAKQDRIVDMILETVEDIDHEALLMTAVMYSNIHSASRALEHVSPNIEYNGSTPLLRSRRPSFFLFLLSAHDIDPNQTDVYGQTPLIFAVRNGWISVVRAIFSKHKGEIDVDRVDNSGRSALCYATELRQDRMIRLILNQ